MNFFVLLENQENAGGGGGYNFVLEQMFLGIKVIFFVFCSILGGKYRIRMNERIFCDVISLKVERPITQNCACFLVLCIPLLVPNFKSINEP